ncbi:MAG: hypothetical protein NTX88_10900 [Candidatus Atribacteria bacterium]|nr:hypothetical protein [Candidatus Atribacteria bacterium]
MNFYARLKRLELVAGVREVLPPVVLFEDDLTPEAYQRRIKELTSQGITSIYTVKFIDDVPGGA